MIIFVKNKNMKKLYIWTTEYEILLSLSETLEDARKELENLHYTEVISV